MDGSRILRRVALCALVSATATAISVDALAALQAHVAIKGKKQGQFKGEGFADKRKDKWAPILSFTFNGASPRDAGSGLPSGKRRYEPVCLVKQWGESTPQLWTAFATNETLSEVDFEFTRTNPNGEEVVYQTVTLMEASIVQMKESSSTTTTKAPGATTDVGEVDEVCFTFRRVTVENKDARTSFTDDLSSP